MSRHAAGLIRSLRGLAVGRGFAGATAAGMAGERVAQDPTLPGHPGGRTEDLTSAEKRGRWPLLCNPLLNRGTNFSAEEREQAGLHGLLPPAVESLDLQAERVMFQVEEECHTDLERYLVLLRLAAANQTLYYHTIMRNLKRLAPIIYTPTVGEACQQFDRIYGNALGMHFDSFRLRGRFARILDNWPSANVQIVVVTDGGRILGLGDLGANGMGIPLGKVALYVAGGGFHPEHSLPAAIDVGTDNQELLDDRFYLGSKQRRLGPEEHMAVMDEFCEAVHAKWPHCLVQFEDFPTDRAFAMLQRFRRRLLCFNDDIQGTAATVVAGIINGAKVQGTRLAELRVLFHGAGSSAVGVVDLLCLLLRQEGGLSAEEAMRRVWAMDSKGIITQDRGDSLAEHKQRVARTDGTPAIKDLREAVARVRPHVLIGLSGRGGTFTQEVVEELCGSCERPLIMALSNPTSKAEITAEHAVAWSGGKALFAAGSPFGPVEHEGKAVEIGQANNVLIFPGVGFGAVMAKARSVEDGMLLAAARALADQVPPQALEQGRLYPRLDGLRDISAHVAAAVVESALQEGVAGIERPADTLEYVRGRMWEPGKPMPGS